MDGHALLDEVRRIFDGEDVAVTPRTLLSDARWLPAPTRPDDLGTLDGARWFLRWLYAGTEGLIETRALPRRDCRFWRQDDLRALGRYLDITRTSEDLYFGVATRQDDTSGALDNCLHLPALFVDLDFKTVAEDEARRQLAAWTPAPSALIASGGGLHAYWKLATPIDLRTDAARAKRLLRRLAVALGGDLAAAEPARILRLPRTCNHKYTPVRPVRLESLHE